MTTTLIQPLDEHNRKLIDNVHPSAYVNPTPQARYNLVVIGAGTAGLITAAAAAGLGAKVALVERHLMGGDCLNVGCVPSKGLIRSSRALHELRRAGEFGARIEGEPEFDFAAMMERMRRLRTHISRNDSVERYTRELGVDVFIGEGKFVGGDIVDVGGTALRFKKAVIATGARAARLPIPGLTDIDCLTNENVFWLTEQPRRLAVIGAGPIGCELGQAFQRFGTEVTILTQDFLPKEESETSGVVLESFRRDGVDVQLGAKITLVTQEGSEKTIHYEADGREHTLTVDAVLLGAGRAPNVEGLGLEQVGVSYTQSGVEVNEQLQTSNASIYAAGDICSKYQFTHAADAMARIVIRNTLFFGRAKTTALTIPWCTYTAPEIAHVGLSERDAVAAGMEVDTFRVNFDDVDRAILDGEDEGFAKAVVRKGSDKIVGVTIVAAHAGEMIGEAVLAMNQGVGLGKFAETIHPYPTQAEVMRKLGDTYNKTRLTPFVKRVFQRLMAWQR